MDRHCFILVLQVTNCWVVHAGWHTHDFLLLVRAVYVGWEYAVEATHGGYGPVERRYHTHDFLLVVRAMYVGWEYAVEATHGGYGPVERRYHMSRRRRWVRTRHLVKPPDAVAVQVRRMTSY